MAANFEVDAHADGWELVHSSHPCDFGKVRQQALVCGNDSVRALTSVDRLANCRRQDYLHTHLESSSASPQQVGMHGNGLLCCHVTDFPRICRHCVDADHNRYAGGRLVARVFGNGVPCGGPHNMRITFHGCPKHTVHLRLPSHKHSYHFMVQDAFSHSMVGSVGFSANIIRGHSDVQVVFQYATSPPVGPHT